jgi:hypothetical protein
MAMPTEASSRARWLSSESKAPARISASIVRRLTSRLSTRRQKSKRSRKAPAAERGFQDRVDRLFAGALDRAETIAHGAAVDRHEAVLGGIDVRAEDAQAVVDRIVVEDS